MDKQRFLKTIFGREGPRENERRYMANSSLRDVIDLAQPWTVDGLKDAVRKWLETYDG